MGGSIRCVLMDLAFEKQSNRIASTVHSHNDALSLSAVLLLGPLPADKACKQQDVCMNIVEVFMLSVREIDTHLANHGGIALDWSSVPVHVVIDCTLEAINEPLTLS